MSGITLVVSDRAFRLGLHALNEASRRRRQVSLDVNYRPLLAPARIFTERIRAAVPLVDVLICSVADAQLLVTAGRDALEIAKALQSGLEVDTVIVTDGANGAVGVDASGSATQAAIAVSQVVDPHWRGRRFRSRRSMWTVD